MRLCALDLAGLQTLGANIGLAYVAILLDRYLLDIGAVRTVRHAMRVAHVTTGLRALTANLTYFGHFILPYKRIEYSAVSSNTKAYEL